MCTHVCARNVCARVNVCMSVRVCVSECLRACGVRACVCVCVRTMCARVVSVSMSVRVFVCVSAHVSTCTQETGRQLQGGQERGGGGRVYEVTVSVAMSMGCSIVSMVVSGPSTSVVMVMMGTVPSSVTSSTTVISSTV